MSKPKQKRPQKRLTQEEKRLIINSYELGLSPAAIGEQLKKTAGSIATFYYRHVAAQFLPPKEKKSKSKIDGRMALLIKNTVTEHPKLGLRRFVGKLSEILPEGSW